MKGCPPDPRPASRWFAAVVHCAPHARHPTHQRNARRGARGFCQAGSDVDLDAVLALDQTVRKLKNDSQTIQADQNRLSREIAKAPTARGP